MLKIVRLFFMILKQLKGMGDSIGGFGEAVI
jgi:hypothetical protein